MLTVDEIEGWQALPDVGPHKLGGVRGYRLDVAMLCEGAALHLDPRATLLMDCPRLLDEIWLILAMFFHSLGCPEMKCRSFRRSRSVVPDIMPLMIALLYVSLTSAVAATTASASKSNPCGDPVTNKSVTDAAAVALLHVLPVEKPGGDTQDIPVLGSYRTFRKIVMAHGWRPIRSADCASSSGEDACRQFPELESCAGPGECILKFSNPQSSCTLQMDTAFQTNPPGEDFTGYEFFQIGSEN